MVAVAARDVEKYTKERIKSRRDHFNPPLALQRHEQNGDGDADSSSNGDGATAFKNNRNHSFNL